MIGTILSGAGAIAGALGGGKSQQLAEQKSGFETLPKEIQDYLLGDIFSRIKSYGNTPFPTVPYRRVDDRESDPIFGSRALRDLQALKDREYMSNPQSPANPTQMAAPQQAQQMADLEARMMARQELEAQAARAGRMNPGADMRMRDYMQTIDPTQMARLGQFMQEKSKIPQGQSIDDLAAKYSAERELLNTFQRGF